MTALMVIAPAYAMAQTAPDSTLAANICLDSSYVELRKKPVDQMTAREYEYFLQKDRACTEMRVTVAAREASSTGKTWKVVAITLGAILLGLAATWVF